MTKADMTAMAVRMLKNDNALELILHFMQGQQKAQENTDRLLHQANIDSLTGLYNQRAFEAMASHELSRRARHLGDMGLVIVDMREFKKVNDTYGHATGNIVLEKVGAALLGAMRESDIIARIGGDEFAVILPDTDSGGVELVCKKLSQMFDSLTHHHIDAQGKPVDIPIRASIGYAMYAHGVTLDELFQRADEAMYANKKSAPGYAPRGESANPPSPAPACKPARF